MIMNNQEIQRYHLHRFPYLLIDCVEDIVPGKSVRGYKNFSENEWLFHCNLHEDVPVPFTMLVEVLIEMLVLPILTLDGNARKIMNDTSADQISVNGDVFPGDRLDVKGTIQSYRRGVAVGISEGYVNDKLIISAKLTFVIPEIMEKFRPKARIGNDRE